MSTELLPSPGKIAGFADLEMLARRKAPQVRAAFNADMASNDGILGRRYRPNHQSRVYLYHMTYALAPAVTFSDESEESSKRLVYTSMKLGIMLADRLLGPVPVAPTNTELKNHLDSVDDFYDYTLGAPMLYLNDDRYALYDLLDTYAEPLAATDIQRARAVLLGGLTLMHTEQARFEQFTREQMLRFRGAIDLLDDNRTNPA